MALGMFSIIPLPKNTWEESAMKNVMAVFPAVGLLIGTLWYLASSLLFGVNCNQISIAFIALLPFFLSGFIHVDGLMDVSDAVFSRRSLDEKHRILKDSHTGAFAVIACVVLLLLQFAAVYELASPNINLVLLPVLSRSVAALALLRLDSISQTGYGAGFKAGTGAKHSICLVFYVVLCFGIAFLMKISLLPLSAALIFGLLTTAYLYKQLHGISGDVCGAIICVAELFGLITLGVFI